MEEIKINLENLSEEEKEQLMSLVEKANKPKTGRWKPKKAEKYWAMSIIAINGTTKICWNDNEFDERSFAIGNVFKTEEEAKFALEKRKVESELQDIADELNDGWEPDFTNSAEQKYNIFYDYRSNTIVVDRNQTHKFAVVYFKNETITEEAIKRIGEERLKKYYFEVE